MTTSNTSKQNTSNPSNKKRIESLEEVETADIYLEVSKKNYLAFTGSIYHKLHFIVNKDKYNTMIKALTSINIYQINKNKQEGSSYYTDLKSNTSVECIVGYIQLPRQYKLQDLILLIKHTFKQYNLTVTG